jgi:hypothetical protein
MKSHRAKIALYKPEEASPVPIAGDAAIAQHGMGEGRMIPLLILDTTKRDDIDELIRIHEHLPPGDVNSQWGRIEHRRDRAISLILQFLRRSRIEDAAFYGRVATRAMSPERSELIGELRRRTNLTPSPSPKRRGEPDAECSPFPYREGGQGVRF